MDRPRLIIHLRILLDIFPISDGWSRIWSKSFLNLSGRAAMMGKEEEEELMARIKMRNLLSSVYFGKTKDVINDLRSQAGLEAKSNEDKLRAELAGRLGGRKVKA